MPGKEYPTETPTAMAINIHRVKNLSKKDSFLITLLFILKCNHPVAFFHDVVHVLHRRDRTHFVIFLFPRLDAGTASEDLATRLEKLLGLLDGIKFIGADLLVFD